MSGPSVGPEQTSAVVFDCDDVNGGSATTTEVIMLEVELQRLVVIEAIDHLSRSSVGRAAVAATGRLIREAWCNLDARNKMAVIDLLRSCELGHVGFVLDELQRRGW
jgi:hypothetical protein